MTVRRRIRRFDGSKRSDAVPLEVRFELAAMRYCREAKWTDLVQFCNLGVGANASYKPDRIRKMVVELLSSLKLPSGNRLP